MQLHISPNTTIKELSDQFTKTFPFLKLEFFRLPHGAGEVSKDPILDHNLTLGSIKQDIPVGVMHLAPTDPVGAVEQRLLLGFGLSVQIFRKSGKSWLETTKTDKFSLEEQNKMGYEATGSISYNAYTLFL